MPVPCSHKVGPRVEGPKLVTCLHLPHLPVLLVASNPMEHEGARLEPSVTTEQKGCEECLSEGPELRRQPHPSEFRVLPAGCRPLLKQTLPHLSPHGLCSLLSVSQELGQKTQLCQEPAEKKLSGSWKLNTSPKFSGRRSKKRKKMSHVTSKEKVLQVPALGSQMKGGLSCSWAAP